MRKQHYNFLSSGEKMPPLIARGQVMETVNAIRDTLDRLEEKEDAGLLAEIKRRKRGRGRGGYARYRE